MAFPSLPFMQTSRGGGGDAVELAEVGNSQQAESAATGDIFETMERARQERAETAEAERGGGGGGGGGDDDGRSIRSKKSSVTSAGGESDIRTKYKAALVVAFKFLVSTLDHVSDFLVSVHSRISLKTLVT